MHEHNHIQISLDYLAINTNVFRCVGLLQFICKCKAFPSLQVSFFLLHHNCDLLTLNLSPLCLLLAFQFVIRTNPHTQRASVTRDFWVKSCGKTEISLSATLHCWVGTNEVTTAARVTQWQTAYSATSSVAAPQGPGSDLFPELHLSHPLFLPLFLVIALWLLYSKNKFFPFSYSNKFSFWIIALGCSQKPEAIKTDHVPQLSLGALFMFVFCLLSSLPGG